MKNQISNAKPDNVSLTLRYDDLVDYQSKIEYAKYFIAINDQAPNMVVFYDSFNTDKLFETLCQTHQVSDEQVCRYRRFDKREERIRLVGFLMHIEQDLMVYFDEDDGEFKILHGDHTPEERIQALVQTARNTVEAPKAESKIFLLYESQKTLCLRDFEVKKNNLNIQENYNDDFEPVHEVIINRLNSANDKGLVLLYGAPGTGKTSYIRYLTSRIDKRMIYIPPEYAYKIASPDFLPLLISNPNSVLIVEDAESIVEARENGRNMSVSNLLNLADGLLSDCLNIQILCTFNTHISKIDKALLRKGRLIATYEFRPLDAEKAQHLSNKIGYNTAIDKPMTLADIYNQSDLGFIKEDKVKIGF
ncbi:AAA family ATPase [Eisenibacter elegans]|jgi:hypothetical protein|uniref:AAA family ATPase n=1 Tax=Eisenibacter elegans TaxID=997 RepID=UPI0006844D57|nr:AAA family ATPase [Eisenibacter elegans]